MAVSHEHPTRLSEPLHRARALLTVGDFHGVHEALLEFDEEIQAAGLAQDPYSTAGWALSMEAHRRGGSPEEAIALGSRWTLRARRHNWTTALSTILSALGDCAIELNDMERALRWFEEALDAARRDGDPAAAAAAAIGEARAWEIQGEDDRCLSRARAAEVDARDAEHGLFTARALSIAARVLIRRGQDALGLLEEAEQLCADAGAHGDRLQILLDRLPIAFRDGDLDGAEALIDRAEEEATLIGGTGLKARVALDRGELLRSRGQPAAARAQYQRALKLLPPGRPLVRIAKLNLALSDLEAGNLEGLADRLEDVITSVRGNRFLTGVAHLLGLAAGPIGPNDDEDQVWARHGTPARLALATSLHHNDLKVVASKAAFRMARGADRVQAGRAALVMGLQNVEDPELVRTLRHSNAALPIGPYLTIHRLGIGGMGQVWLARHVDRDRPSAVKVLNPDQQDSAFAWDSLDTELKAISSLSHPNIVRLLDHGRVGFAAGALSGGRIQQHSPYLALEYVPGGVLTPWIGKLSWIGVRNVLDDLLSALAHAHAHRVLHLDLKPDNILLADRTDPLGGVKLVDFGLALFRKASREIFAGTPQFMAPEQVQKGHEYGPWTDLYALGCLGWAMATGAAPFDHPDRKEMARLQAREAPPPFEPRIDVPDGFEDWLRALLQKKVVDRPDRASEARSNLLALEAFPPQRSRLPSFVPLPDAGLALVQELEPELVGRQAEREQLWRAFQRAKDTPIVVEVSGPLGSGRSALMGWLAAHTHEEGQSEVLLHRLDTGFQGLQTEGLDVEALSTAILDRFARRRRTRTALLLVDGADPLAVEVVQHLRTAATFPLIVLVRSAPAAVTDPTVRVPVPPLRDEVMASVLRGVLPLAGRLESNLLGWAQGNPGLAVAAVRALGSEGELRPTLDGWDVPHLRAFRVPDSIRAALDADLSPPTPGFAAALEVAAALGTEFDGLRWQQLTPAAEAVAERLVAAAILEQQGTATFDERQFRWIQPAAQHLVAARPATRLAHARIAEELRSEGGSAARIGTHFVEARRYADAHRPLLDAVKASIEEGDETAARHYLGMWEDALERLAVSSSDPRRLAGQRLKARLEI